MMGARRASIVTFAGDIGVVQVSKRHVQRMIRESEELKALRPLLWEHNWWPKFRAWCVDRGIASFLQLEERVTRWWERNGARWPQEFGAPTGAGPTVTPLNSEADAVVESSDVHLMRRVL